MNEQTPIIDVTPINHSSSRISGGQKRASSQRGGQSRQSSTAGGAYRYAQQQGGEGAARTGWSPLSAAGGLAQMVLGAGLIAIGVPMLILPGPGLLSIAAGGLLIARGFGKVVGR